jgi:hypothetical protein
MKITAGIDVGANSVKAAIVSWKDRADRGERTWFPNLAGYGRIRRDIGRVAGTYAPSDRSLPAAGAVRASPGLKWPFAPGTSAG